MTIAKIRTTSAAKAHAFADENACALLWDDQRALHH